MIILQWLSFLIDLPSMEAWCKSTFGDQYSYIRATSTLSVSLMLPATTEQLNQVKAYLAGLTSDGEAAKRAKNSRMLGAPAKRVQMAAFEAAVKLHIAAKDITTLSAAEKKFFMGAVLTNDEYDTLTTS